jgi:rsbT co-antagonist protein RsbR
MESQPSAAIHMQPKSSEHLHPYDPTTLFRYYQQIFDSLPIIVTMLEIVDGDKYRILMVNYTALETAGFPMSIGKYLHEYLPKAEYEAMVECYHECIATGAKVEREAPIVDVHNNRIWLSNLFVPVPDASGKIAYILTVSQDITERKQREEQHLSMMLAELSTPMLTISDTTVVIPLIGLIDSYRIQQMMTTLLEGVAETRARNVIIDITGVPLVDTQVADTLLRAAQSVRLLGAQIILSGIRPEVAQVLVSLGIDFSHIPTRSTLQSAIAATLFTGQPNEHRGSL